MCTVYFEQQIGHPDPRHWVVRWSMEQHHWLQFGMWLEIGISLFKANDNHHQIRWLASKPKARAPTDRRRGSLSLRKSMIWGKFLSTAYFNVWGPKHRENSRRIACDRIMISADLESYGIQPLATWSQTCTNGGCWASGIEDILPGHRPSFV